MKRGAALTVLLVAIVFAWVSEGSAVGAGLADAGRLARLDEANSFPVAVWLQSPANAGRYRAAGINLYVGLWNGPTEDQLRVLREADMAVVCEQNKTGLAHLSDPTIVGWMHGDEPDNAQSQGEGKGYGPPVPPETIVRQYQAIRAADPSRPVMLNLGQGVAWDGWYGRGVRTNHPEDYPEYIKGCDIVSFDIYPAVHDHPQVAGNLWVVAQGVDRLVKWADGKKRVWNCIECTRIGNPKQKATPHQVRCEVWMSIIHGSQGLIYFVHEWQPKFNEAALLSDPNMLTAVTAINHRIQALAPVLNTPSVPDGMTVTTSAGTKAPVTAVLKRHLGTTYVFAVSERGQSTTVTFQVRGMTGEVPVTVLDENRTLASKDGAFADAFQPWDVHLYRLGGMAPLLAVAREPLANGLWGGVEEPGCRFNAMGLGMENDSQSQGKLVRAGLHTYPHQGDTMFLSHPFFLIFPLDCGRGQPRIGDVLEGDGLEDVGPSQGFFCFFPCGL